MVDFVVKETNRLTETDESVNSDVCLCAVHISACEEHSTVGGCEYAAAKVHQ